MATSPANICPSCRLPHALKRHCESPGCPWARCTQCRITLDPIARRGFTRDGEGLQLPQEHP